VVNFKFNNDYFNGSKFGSSFLKTATGFGIPDVKYLFPVKGWTEISSVVRDRLIMVLSLPPRRKKFLE
jgi:hypothetical protein